MLTSAAEESSISESSSVDSSYTGPPATVGGVHSVQASDAIIGVVVGVAAVVVLVIVGTVVIASPIAWKLRKGRKTNASMNCAVHIYLFCMVQLRCGT